MCLNWGWIFKPQHRSVTAVNRCHFLKFTEYCNNEANQVVEAPYDWSILYLRYRSHDRSSDYVQYEGGIYKKGASQDVNLMLIVTAII